MKVVCNLLLELQSYFLQNSNRLIFYSLITQPRSTWNEIMQATVCPLVSEHDFYTNRAEHVKHKTPQILKI